MLNSGAQALNPVCSAANCRLSSLYPVSDQLRKQQANIPQLLPSAHAHTRANYEREYNIVVGTDCPGRVYIQQVPSAPTLIPGPLICTPFTPGLNLEIVNQPIRNRR